MKYNKQIIEFCIKILKVKRCNDLPELKNKRCLECLFYPRCYIRDSSGELKASKQVALEIIKEILYKEED